MFGSWRQQKTGWSFDDAVVIRSMFGLVLHRPKHSVSKSYQPCNSWSRSSCLRRRSTDVSQVRPTAYLRCPSFQLRLRLTVHLAKKRQNYYIGTESTTNSDNTGESFSKLPVPKTEHDYIMQRGNAARAF